MSLFQKLFSISPSLPPRPLPSWDEAVEEMQGKDLPQIPAENLQILVSKDRAKRILIIHSPSGYYTTCYEELQLRDKDEWVYLSQYPNCRAAWWEKSENSILNNNSFYGTLEEAMKEIKSTYEFGKYFL